MSDETVEANAAGNNEYVITVRATEMQDEGETKATLALSSAKAIIVDSHRRAGARYGDHQLAPQPEATTDHRGFVLTIPTTAKTPKSPFTDTGAAYQWFVPKVIEACA